jgi:uncharacterized protein (DUF3084 family)
MHTTAAGERRKTLKGDARELARDAKSLQKAAARLPAARKKAQRLQAEADSALAEAEALKVQARLEDLNMWKRELVKESKKGPKTYTYWMASWREADKTRWPGVAPGRWMPRRPGRKPGG